MATDYKIRLKRFNGTDYDTLNLVSSNVVMDNGDTLQNKLENYSRPNLLDNWYFVGGGSQQGGGQFPINQRGQTTYYSSNGFCLDRWENEGSVTISSGYVTTGSVFRQGCEKSLMDTLLGRTVTLSYLKADGTLVSGQVTLPSSYPSSTTKYQATTGLYIALYDGGGGQSFRIEGSQNVVAVKLELGNTQTLAHQENGTWIINETPDYEEQLIKCSTAHSSDTYANKVVAYTPKTVSYTIDYSLWTTSTDYYYQTITIPNAIITSKTKVDIQADSTAINQLIADGVTALYINNSSGTLTLYAIGNPTTVNITVQLTYYETA